MELSVGDVVVVPALGPGVVEAHESVDIGQHSVDAWRIELGGSRGTMYVPNNARGAEGLRAPMSAEVVPGIWKTISRQAAPKHRRNWNQRRRRYEQMLHSNSPTSLAELLGELARVRARKAHKNQRLSFGERRMLERARDLLAREVAISSGRPQEAVEARLDDVIEATPTENPQP